MKQGADTGQASLILKLWRFWGVAVNMRNRGESSLMPSFLTGVTSFVGSIGGFRGKECGVSGVGPACRAVIQKVYAENSMD